MGRGRGKGKKLTVVASHEDPGSGGEDALPAYKRRGRPQKPLKDEIEEEDAGKLEEEEEEEEDGASKPSDSSKVGNFQVPTENGRKRKRQVKEKADSVAEVNGGGRSINGEMKPNGFRQNGRNRKSTPRRAAEAGVECK
ncbi:hypothetical protein AMTRI_Chr03g44550 [Amborella trichopoda]|uniref:Uncharacterized protein n=1 Tax=Amborella trichopoda TaxID=13333 RepID=W1PNM4_AMBTC|nr:uncharacterized protein LOC18439826 [Amborella trichopoda]ERN11627.1 hypothetical protein AMTR_s00022p00196900 [Amborella trichopoda]|eukprot:XP_011625437.1 uncharacterized protein LOC18439826 [Amborella trichopoda]